MDKIFENKEQIVDDLINDGIVAANKRKLMECIIQGVYVQGIDSAFKHIEDGMKNLFIERN